MAKRGRPPKPRCETCGAILEGGVCRACSPCEPELVETVERPVPRPLTRGDEYAVLILEELRGLRADLRGRQ